MYRKLTILSHFTCRKCFFVNRLATVLSGRYTYEQNQFFGNKVLNKSCSSTSFGEQKICTGTSFIYCFVPEKLVMFLSCSGTFHKT